MNREALAQFYNKYKVYIIPIVIGISSLTLIFFVIYPQVIKLINNNSAQGDLVSRSKFLEAKAAELQNINETDLSKKLNLALTALPGEKDFGEIIGLVQRISTQNSFNITSLELTSSAEASPSANTDHSQKSSAYNITIEAIGPKIGLNSLLVGIENTPRVMRVDGITITAGKDPNIISAVIKVNVYYSPVPTKIGSVDALLPQLSAQDEDLLLKLARTAGSTTTTTSLSPRGKSNPFN